MKKMAIFAAVLLIALSTAGCAGKCVDAGLRLFILPGHNAIEFRYNGS